MLRLFTAFVTVVLLVSCGDSGQTSTANSEVLPTVPNMPPAPIPNWAEEDEGVYFYIASLSPQDIEEGKAAGDVIAYRYLGKNSDGEHVLANIANDGSIAYRAYCADDCSIIRYENGQRIAYSPNSIIGSAFNDAMRGLLVESGTGRRGPSSRTEMASPPQLSQISQSDWNQLGLGCSCSFVETGANAPILIAGGSERVIIRPGGDQEICSLRSGHMQEMFNGDVTLTCANSRISIREIAEREMNGDGHTSPATMTVQWGGGSQDRSGNWSCAC